MKYLFSQELNRQLLAYYGRMPSASIFARDFNLRAVDVSHITQETARRWMRGMSIPELDKLQVIIEWLDLNLPFLFNKDQVSNNNIRQKQSKSSHQNNENLLLKAYRETDIRGKQILLSIANVLISGKIPADILS